MSLLTEALINGTVTDEWNQGAWPRDIAAAARLSMQELYARRLALGLKDRVYTPRMFTAEQTADLRRYADELRPPWLAPLRARWRHPHPEEEDTR